MSCGSLAVSYRVILSGGEIWSVGGLHAFGLLWKDSERM